MSTQRIYLNGSLIYNCPHCTRETVVVHLLGHLPIIYYCNGCGKPILVRAVFSRAAPQAGQADSIPPMDYPETEND